ncbi:hypothetical protein EW146_g1286 [Bondarzewia mesenterica]|uniref:Uncharacterized protein n=1 Tax=Bondarzewia mesenterica TaxID=1095465 RepID=A0A4S4M6M1_9AGAM|nr:hypothetical protein EW146_g1286 [Bondarzewia mesenterica]
MPRAMIREWLARRDAIDECAQPQRGGHLKFVPPVWFDLVQADLGDRGELANLLCHKCARERLPQRSSTTTFSITRSIEEYQVDDTNTLGWLPRLGAGTPYSPVLTSVLDYDNFGDHCHSPSVHCTILCLDFRAFREKKRQWRVEEVVVPQLQLEKPEVEKRIISEMKKDKVRGTKDELREMYKKRVRDAVDLPAQLTARRKQLFSEHRCTPMLTMLLPPLTQLPLFAGTSIMLSHTAQPPTVFDSEAFLTLTSLAHADPTVALPIALGIITLANVESSRWFISDTARERDAAEAQRVAEKRAQGHLVLEPRKIVQSGLRVLSVGRILIGAMVPGATILYWVSSATFWIVPNLGV